MNMFIKISKILLVFFCYVFTSGFILNAHEFCIEPLQYINDNNEIEAPLRVVQHFEGMTVRYNTTDLTNCNIYSGSKNKKNNVKGVLSNVTDLNIKK